MWLLWSNLENWIIPKNFRKKVILYPKIIYSANKTSLKPKRFLHINFLFSLRNLSLQVIARRDIFSLLIYLSRCNARWSIVNVAKVVQLHRFLALLRRPGTMWYISKFFGIMHIFLYILVLPAPFYSDICLSFSFS